MTSGEGLQRPGKREFLKRAALSAVAGAAAFAGATKIFNKFPKQDAIASGVDKQPLSKEKMAQLKDRKATIDIEKKILNSFDARDSEQIGTGIVPDKVYNLSKKRNDAVVNSSFAAGGTIAATTLAHVLLRSKDGEQKSPKVDRSSAMESLKGLKVPVGTAATAIASLGTTTYLARDIINESSENIKDAEARVVAWIQKYNTEKKFTSVDSVMKAIEDQIAELNKEQENITDALSLAGGLK